MKSRILIGQVSGPEVGWWHVTKSNRRWGFIIDYLTMFNDQETGSIPPHVGNCIPHHY